MTNKKNIEDNKNPEEKIEKKLSTKASEKPVKEVSTKATSSKSKTEKKPSEKKADVAVIASGSHQFIVHVGDILSLEKLSYGKDNKVTFNDVLLFSSETETLVGQPTLDNVTVSAEVLSTEKDKKQIGMKFKRKTGYKKIFGHRQTLTTVKITKINKK